MLFINIDLPIIIDILHHYFRIKKSDPSNSQKSVKSYSETFYFKIDMRKIYLLTSINKRCMTLQLMLDFTEDFKANSDKENFRSNNNRFLLNLPLK